MAYYSYFLSVLNLVTGIHTHHIFIKEQLIKYLRVSYSPLALLSCNVITGHVHGQKKGSRSSSSSFTCKLRGSREISKDK